MIICYNFRNMKNLLMFCAACLIFTSAAAQLEPKTSQKPVSDTIIPVNTNKSDDNIANKGIIKTNTIESGLGKPDNIKRKLKLPKPTTAPPVIGPKIKDTKAVKRKR